jgi:ribulose-5-phosphate 4-epimerase/fuculose-1-phosphate aldolase
MRLYFTVTAGKVSTEAIELLVHRMIYQQTPAPAVVHWRPRTAIAFSLSREVIVPIDNQASCLLKKIPLVTEEFASGTPQMANKVATALRNYSQAQPV